MGSIGAVAAIALSISACATHHISGSPAPTTASGPAPSVATSAAVPCDLPHFGDLIEWQRRPGKVDSARRFSDVDKTKCEPALDGWMEGMPSGSGVCFMIGWASDNPGYNPNAVPAPPLKKVIDKVGDAC
jgi:hypothetical protein